MSYESMWNLGNDEVFIGRVRVCAYAHCQALLDNPYRADWSNFAYDTLRAADHAMDSWVRIVARTPEVADAAGDPPDQSRVNDLTIEQAVEAGFPVVVSLYYGPDGLPWSGDTHEPQEPQDMPHPEHPIVIPPDGGGEIPPPIPEAHAVAPTSGPAGTNITITGVGLTTAAKVTIGAKDCTNVVVVDDATVTATLSTYSPQQKGTFPVVVTLADSTVLTGPDFTVS